MPDGSKVVYFGFKDSATLDDVDRHTLYKFGASRAWEALHLMAMAIKGTEKAMFALHSIYESERDLIDSDLITPEEAERVKARQGEMEMTIKGFLPVIHNLKAERQRRLADLTAMEQAHNEEYEEQRRKKGELVEKSAQKTPEPHEVLGPVRPVLDRKLLFETIKSLNTKESPSSKLSGR